MTAELVAYKVQPPATGALVTSQELGMIKAIAATAQGAAGLLPQINGKNMTEGQATVIMLYGHELGVGPMAALGQIFVVKNRPSASAQLLLGLMQSRDPHAGVEILERTAEKAKIRITYKGRSQEFEATIEDAKLADLMKNPTWSKYPKQMLVWTAVRTGVRLMAADAINALASLAPFSEVQAEIEAAEAEAIDAEAIDVTTIEPETSAITDEGEGDSEPETPEHRHSASGAAHEHKPGTTEPPEADPQPPPPPPPTEPEAAEETPPGCDHPTWRSTGAGGIVCKTCGVHRADVEMAARKG